MLSSRPFATVNISLGALSALAAFGVAPALTRCYSGLLTLFGRIAVRTADGQDAIADNAAVPAARPGTIIRVVGSDGHTLQEKQQNKLQSCVSQPAVAALCCSRRISTPLAVAGIQQQGLRACASAAAAGVDKEATYSQDARAITRSIRDAQSIQQLTDIIQQSSSSFNAIHTAAAFTKAAKLAGTAAVEEGVQPLLQQLAVVWKAVLHQATVRELSNCLWACAKLGYSNAEVWSCSIAAALQQLGPNANGQDLSNLAYALAVAVDPHSSDSLVVYEQQAGTGELLVRITSLLVARIEGPAANSISVRHISTVLWANAKVGKVPAAKDVEVLLQAYTRPWPAAVGHSTSSNTAAQSLANALWAVSELQQLSGADLNLPNALWRQLLGPKQLQQIASGGAHAVSSTLRALGLLATAEGHTLAVPFAQQCAAQLLQGPTAQQISDWSPVDIAAAVFGCSKIGVKDMQFLQAVAAASPDWLPAASAANVNQIAYACAKLRFRHPQLMDALVHHGKQLMHGDRHHVHVITPRQDERVTLAATLSWAVAVLNFNHLAGDVKALLVGSGIKHMQESFPGAVARMFPPPAASTDFTSTSNLVISTRSRLT